MLWKAQGTKVTKPLLGRKSTVGTASERAVQAERSERAEQISIGLRRERSKQEKLWVLPCQCKKAPTLWGSGKIPQEPGPGHGRDQTSQLLRSSVLISSFLAFCFPLGERQYSFCISSSWLIWCLSKERINEKHTGFPSLPNLSGSFHFCSKNAHALSV